MARSYKKHNWVTERQYASGRGINMKDVANRRVRKSHKMEMIPSGRWYRKIVCSYDICDFRWFVHDTSKRSRSK